MLSPEDKAREFLIKYWDKKIPINPIIIANKIGVKVFYSNWIGVDGNSGKIIKDDNNNYQILLNQDELPEKKRFIIAHELGHIAFEHETSNRDNKNYSLNDYIKAESQANYFAAELLMPREYVIYAIELNYSLNEMAKKFGVSEKTMAIKLKNLSFI